jgi:hypothetical protein
MLSGMDMIDGAMERDAMEMNQPKQSYGFAIFRATWHLGAA